MQDGLKENDFRQSHSSWVRGLKQIVEAEDNFKRGRTLRECVDWNLHLDAVLYAKHVALFVSAWIETFQTGQLLHLILVALFVSAWIETIMSMAWRSSTMRRTLRECVDWNDTENTVVRNVEASRTLRECVDWNIQIYMLWIHLVVALFVSAWIETK